MKGRLATAIFALVEALWDRTQRWKFSTTNRWTATAWMHAEDFRMLAGIIHDVVLKNADVKERVKSLRKGFLELQFCFRGDEYDELIQRLHRLL